MLGELAALSAALCWSIASVLFARLGASASLAPRAMNIIKCSVALSLMALTLLISSGLTWPEHISALHYTALATSGVIGLTLGDTAYFHALLRLGPRRTLLFSTLGPPLTALIAWPALDEPITALMLLGMALTLGGIIWVIQERSTSTTQHTQHLSREEWLGIGFAIAAVACQAVGNIFTKYGSQELTSLQTSMVRLSAGSLGLLLWLGWRGEWRTLVAPFTQRRTALTLLLASFLGTYLGIWLLVTGLQLTKAGIAATLSAMSPIFILPIAAFALKEHVSKRAILGAIIAVAGVALLLLTAP